MQEYVTLSNLEIEENVIGSSNFLYTEPEQEYNLITGYTQSHNLKDHMRKKHNSI